MQPPPSSREIQGGLSSLLGLHAAAAGDDGFFDQVMLSSALPAWPDLAPANADGPIELPAEAAARHYQIGNGGSKAAMMMMQQQHHHQMLLMPHDVADGSGQGGGGGGAHGAAAAAAVHSLYDGFAGSLHASGQAPNPTQLFHPPQQGGGAIQAAQNFAAQAAAASSSAGGGAPAAQPKQQRVRARRGQATDPHSIAERLRRERIAERMKALQELVPNANKTDKASMLDEIVDYVKFLQLQVKVLSASRLGAAGGVAPLVAAMSSEGGGADCIQAGTNGRTLGRNGSNGGHQAASSSSTGDGLMVAENQVAKLMEEDMGSAMQYLQGKGLCLMPISLATTISSAASQRPRTAAARPHNPAALGPGGEGPPVSPSVSILTVQSAALGNGLDGGSGKDAASVSKP